MRLKDVEFNGTAQDTDEISTWGIDPLKAFTVAIDKELDQDREDVDLGQILAFTHAIRNGLEDLEDALSRYAERGAES